ncbi:MAG: hypothetical protein HY966_00480 [Ignavibacteriales bacterium]|nr:hypothetical protein [Ignavibacteriales bacterium]
MNVPRKKIALIVALAAGVSVLSAQRTVRINLERMVQQSGAIIHATVQRVESGRDRRTKLLFTTVTLAVKENFYGAPNQTYSFRQYGGTDKGIAFYPSKMVQYKPGQEVIVLLYPASEMNFQSSVGAEQGVFYVSTTNAGQATVANAVKNRDLFKGTSQKRVLGKLVSLHEMNPGALPLEDFAQAVRSLIRIYKKEGVR